MSSQPCPECGRPLRSGVRVTTSSTIRVLVCLDSKTGGGCGHETPPLYKRTKPHRDWNYDYLPLRAAAHQEETANHGG